MTSKILSGALVLAVWGATIAGQAPDAGLPRRPALGVALAAVENGARVTGVTAGSAAEAGDVRADDVINEIDGAAVRGPADVIAGVARHRAGETMRFSIVRDGRPESRALVLGSLPRETLPGVTFEYGAVALDDGSRLRTIVSLPTGDDAARRPAVMLVQGGGCGSIDTPLTPDFGEPGLVRTLARLGYVTLRVEKSGIGDSRGPSCADIGYTQELNGYRAALAALKRHPAVDPARVVLLGISLGGVFAPALANESPVLGIVVWGTLDVPPSPYAGRSDRFFREIAEVDLAAAWSGVSARVLALHGQFDEATREADHAHIAALVSARHPGMATHVELPGLDHCWTWHESMEKSRGHCGAGQPDSTLSETIVRFVQRVAPVRG